MEETENKKEEYISLFEAAKLCSYSEPYLRLRARAGKLKSIKLGKKWMTTATWLKEYETRVAEWRQATEAKKAVVEAVLVSAPAQLSGNLAESAKESKEEIPAAQIADQNLTATRPAIPVWDFTKGDDMPTLPSRRPLANFASSGQIFPVPKQSKEADTGHADHLVWLSALVSGAVCALALAFMVAGSSGLGDVAAKAQISKANVSEAVTLSPDTEAVESEILNEGEGVIDNIKEQFSADNLKTLVEEVANFIKNFDVSGW